VPLFQRRGRPGWAAAVGTFSSSCSAYEKDAGVLLYEKDCTALGGVVIVVALLQ
jgi:hypothetical protein